jgi:hypothetical protein
VRTLELTTPLMRGEDVKLMQGALKRKGYYKGETDGVWGILSSQAAQRAKYWLGYRKPDKVAGDLLLAYLQDRKNPTKVMAFYRARRLRLKAKVPMRVKALNAAIARIGETENPPNSNRSPASLWYGLIGAWCAMSVTRSYVTAGSKAWIRGKFYAYCPFIYHDAMGGRNNLTITTHPQPGDVVLYDWGNPDRLARHVGLFEGWLPGSQDRFTAIEGNTGVGNDSNGGKQMRRGEGNDIRSMSMVLAFVHVGG